MIVYAPEPPAAAAPVAKAVAEHSVSARSFETSTSGGNPAPEPLFVTGQGDTLELRSPQESVQEHFNWGNEKVTREFIQLEQKVLARKADQEEFERYEMMKQDRNSRIFADRYIRDYAEIQRLRKLNEKLAELQQYLHPVRV